MLLCAVIPARCFAQTNRTESVTITTYYPAPHGVYNTLRLYPSTQPSALSPISKAGTMFFNKTDQKLYIYNGTFPGKWERIGSGISGSSGVVVDSGHKVWPDTCPGTIVMRTHQCGSAVGTQSSLCPVPWRKKISFSKTFSKPPQVFVSAETLSGRLENNKGDDYTCGEHSTDVLQAYAEDITEVDFELRIGSSAGSGSCCCLVNDCLGATDWIVTEYYGKGEASWIAIGK